MLGFSALAIPLAGHAEQTRVVYLQGAAHAFVEVTTLEGKRIAVGDLVRRVRGRVVTARLTLKFQDGSLDDETTTFSQDRVFRLIRDHHVQRGLSFPKPIDVTVDPPREEVVSKDEHGKMTRTHIQMPADIGNGLTLTIVTNVAPTTRETRFSAIAGSDKPRLIHLAIRNSGELIFALGGERRQATDYAVHVEIGGVAGVVAPVIGKQPPDYHIVVTSGCDAAFLREEGSLFEGGPVWRIQSLTATLPQK